MIELRKVHKTEYQLITNLHIKVFENYFLTSLGSRFLNTYYKAVLSNDGALCICALDETNTLCGFSVGCLNSKGFHSNIVRENLISFMKCGVELLFTNPKSIIRLIKNFSKDPNPNDDGQYGELLSLAVAPALRSKGIGLKLLTTFEQEAKKRDCMKIALTTDFYQNESVLRFYKKCGYEVYYKFITYPERKMYKLIKYLT